MTGSTGKDSKHLSFGQSIHTAIAKYNMINDDAYRTLDNLHSLLRKNWNRQGYEDIAEEKAYGIKAIDMLTKYFNSSLDQGQKNLLIEEMIKKNMDDKFVLCGKLDKLYVRNDGLVEVTDYKTGNNIEPIIDIQLAVYILLAKERIGSFPDIISYYYLAHNEKIEQVVEEETVNNVIQYLWEIYGDISSEREFSCTPTRACETYCEYFEICNPVNDLNQMVINELKMPMSDSELDGIF